MRRRGYLKDHRGFTLIEMAVVLVIVGIIISIVAGILPSLIASSKIKQTKALLERADNAIQGYALARHRLPFADSNNDGVEDAGVFIGTLPYQTLGLPFQQDIWGNPFKYAVYGGGSTSTADLTQTFADANAFCTEISNAISSVFDPTIGHIINDSSCPSPTATNASNQAYLLASPGLRDMNGSAGKYDGCNSAAGTSFSLPDAILTDTYDDLVVALSLVELNQKECTGSSNGGGTPTTEVCDDAAGADEDGDGLANCSDPDCAAHSACTSPSLSIVTATIPSGTMNSSYMTSFSASGGATPYQWSLTGNGGFTDFSMNPVSGTLTGTLDQCPGSYTVQVRVEDVTPGGSGGPLNTTGSFTLLVTGNLTVAHTSGSGGAITWSSASQTETFSVSGACLGTITWSLNTGGAAGFEVVSTGTDTCAIRKTGTTTPGTYTFTLTATDTSCSTNSADIALSVTVTGSGGGAPGTIDGVVSSLEFNTTSAANPEIIHVSGDVYAIAYAGPNNDGYIATVSINGSGTISGSTIQTRIFDYGSCENPRLVHISDDIYAVAYTGSGDAGILATIRISDTGAISAGTVSSLRFDSWFCYEPDILHISGDVYAVAYSASGYDGYVHTVRISSAGIITNSLIDTLAFETGRAYEADLIHISGDVYAIAYAGTAMVSDGFVCTLTIDAAGNIGGSTIDKWQFESGFCYDPGIVQVSGDVFAIAYRGPNDDGFLQTLRIAADGSITKHSQDSFEFDANECYEPEIISMGAGVFGIAYRGQSNHGYLSTIRIEDDGQIAEPVLDTIEFDTSSGYEPYIASAGAGIYAIVYRGRNNDGFVVTVAMQ